MAKTYSVPEFRLRLAKHIRGVIVRVADDIQDLSKRELFKNTLLGDAHVEPGGHEAPEVGVGEHMEPGGHEKFSLNPPAGPDAGVSEPIHGGAGIPGAEMGPPPGAQSNDDTCPLCHQPDRPGSCTCLSDMVLGKNEMCKSCGKSHGEKCGEMDPAKKSEANPGATKDPSKQQPTPPVAGSKLPGEESKEIKSKGSGGTPKKNPLGKAAVPEAKPPSGKIPGGTSAPPMAHNSSKPGLAKEGELEKGALNPQAKQHGLIDASKQAAGVTGGPAIAGPGAGQKLTNPNDSSRANMLGAAQAGAFQPKGPVTSGLELAGKPKGPAPVLAAPPAAVREKPKAAVGPPAGAAASKPVMNAARPAVPKPGLLGSLFGKSEKCVFCGALEHPGNCTKK